MPNPDTHSWFFWEILSACFAALTAIFAKVGLEGIDSEYPTLVRTSSELLVAGPGRFKMR
jgi:transporter family protein